MTRRSHYTNDKPMTSFALENSKNKIYHIFFWLCGTSLSSYQKCTYSITHVLYYVTIANIDVSFLTSAALCLSWNFTVNSIEEKSKSVYSKQLKGLLWWRETTTLAVSIILVLVRIRIEYLCTWLIATENTWLKDVMRYFKTILLIFIFQRKNTLIKTMGDEMQEESTCDNTETWKYHRITS